MEGELICGDCNMVFRSTELLEKHKALFCIGSQAEPLWAKSHSSQPPVRDKAGCVDPKQTRTPDLVQMRGQRRNTTRRRSVDAKPKSARAEDTAATGRTETAALQDLTDEFHKLRMSIEENLPNWSKRRTDTEESGRRPGHGDRLREMREMTALHERQLGLIRAHNQQLEQQRDELAHQVSVLSEQSNTTHLQGLLMELREQEERNEETLQQLAEHLHALHVREVSEPADQPDPRRNKKMHQDNYELISSADGPLSTQIQALRRAYLQSGGSDPAIVARMIDLQAEAQSLEKTQPAPAAGKKVRPPRRGPSWELLAVEEENQRLEEEILRIQLARERHQNYKVRTQLELIQRENFLQIPSLQAEMERSKEATRPRRRPPPPPPPPPHLLPHQPKTHIHAPLPLLQARSFSPLGRGPLDSLDSLGPAPYDPVAGFVVFYDLVLGVDVSQRALRLVAAFYSDGREVGPPTPLPPVQCLPDTHSLAPKACALLSAKQPVPRIQPSLSLSLLVEVQTARDPDVHGHEVFKLTPCGWTRLELFDQYNQLHSGHWRVPVRRLPIRPSFSLAQLNSVAQVDSMELCVRLVNGRDGDVQTLAKPDPTSTHHYKYPPVVSSDPASVHRRAALTPSAAQLSDGDQLSSLLPVTEHRDPPATEEASQG